MNINKQSGQASRMLLVLAVIIFVAVIIVFLVMKMATPAPKPAAPATAPVVQLPVYENQLGNIDFIFESALDKGTVLKKTDIINKEFQQYDQKDLDVDNPGAKFIQVTIGAENKGTLNTELNAWTVQNIVDDQKREFVPLQKYLVAPWLPNPDLCGTLLKPAFAPTPCVKIYEVSNQSTGLKIRVETGKGNNSASDLSGGRISSSLIDLIVK